MRFSSEKQRKAVFASFKNRFSREGLPGLGDALVGSIVESWPDNGSVRDSSTSVYVNEPQPDISMPVQLQQVPTTQVLDKPLSMQFKLAIEDKMGESELYRNMAQKVNQQDASQLNYMAEQQDWNKDSLVEMAPRYTEMTNFEKINVDNNNNGISDAVEQYKPEFSIEPTDDDYIAGDYFDIDPDIMAKRDTKKMEGKELAPFIGREKFIEDYKELKYDKTGSGDEFYDVYLISDSKNHIDFIKRIGVPTDEDMVNGSGIPSNFIRDEVSGIIPESQLQKVKDIVDTYEIDGGYVFIGGVDDVEKAKQYVR